jgi:hypothetical protein
VQITAPELLGLVTDTLTRLFDVSFTREYTNCYARADLVIDGQTLLEDVPSAYFLFLETQLTKLISEFIDHLPGLDPARDWHPNDPGQPAGVWTSSPRVTTRSKKVPQVQVLYPDTEHHPAQVRHWDADEVVGDWTRISLSGQLPPRVITEIRDRAMRLLAAVRSAREEANTEEVRDRAAGETILGWVFAPATITG